MRLPVALTFLLLSSAPLLAQDDVWRASSKSTISVTGDITMEADRIVFGNGAILRLVPVQARIGVFRADPPANPVLLNGKRLCRADVTYVVLAEGHDDVLFMKAFDGEEPPHEAISDSAPQEGSCATYQFKR